MFAPSHTKQELRYCARSELRFHKLADDAALEEESQLQGRWIGFDPVTRQSYRLGWLEHWLLRTLQSTTEGLSRSQLLQQLECHGLTVTPEHILRKLTELRQAQLVREMGADPSAATAEASAVRSPWAAKDQLHKLWSCRIRGPNPDRWLAGIAPWTHCLLSSRAVAVWLLAALATSLAIGFDFQRLFRQLGWLNTSSVHQAGTVEEVLQAALRFETGGLFCLVFLATRIVHELGHALACKRFQVRCPDIGVLFVLGAPCVYCDVSESWRLPRARDRAAIAAAGVYFELILATLAAWFWLLTAEGPWNTLALQTWICCSVCTLLINANPLMRFDGYYILADWLGESNLRQKSNQLAQQWFTSLLVGTMPSRSVAIDPSMSTRRRHAALIGFALAGLAYRVLVSFTLASIVLWTGASWNLIWFGRLFAVLLLASWWMPPMIRTLTSLATNARTTASRVRLGLTALAASVVFFAVPIPQRERASGWIQPSELRGIYAHSDARLQACYVEDGSLVETNQPLFQLANPKLQLNRLKQDQQLAVTQVRYASARRQRDMYGQARSLSELASAIETAQALRLSAEDSCSKLTLSAPASGTFCAVEAPSAHRALDGAAPRSAQVHWCDDNQIGRHLAKGTMLGFVCSEDALVAIPLTNRQLGIVAEGTDVRLKLPAAECPEVHQGKVASVVRYEQLQTIQSWRGIRGAEPDSQAPYEGFSASQTPFAAIVRLAKRESGSANDLTLRPGTSVKAVFVTPRKTLFQMSLDWLSLNVRWLAA